jgi:hypothetical protein
VQNELGYRPVVPAHDPIRDVQRFDAYRAALREAVGADTTNELRPRVLKSRHVRRRKRAKASE